MTKVTAVVVLAAAQALAAAIVVSAATVTAYATDAPAASGAYVSPETEPMAKAAPYVLTTTTAPNTATTAAPAAPDPYKKNCYASGERNQGAVGHSHVKLMPCCVEGEYGQEVGGDWGRFCLPAPTTGSSACYGPGERTVLYRPCCDGRAARPKAGDWGKFCPDGDGDANDDDSVECYGPGERIQASRGYPAVPYKPCCDGQAARSKPGNWGMFCPDGVSCTQGETPWDGSCCASELQQECLFSSFGIPQEKRFQGFDWNRCRRSCYWWATKNGGCLKRRTSCGGGGGGGGGAPPSDCEYDTEPGEPYPPSCPDDISQDPVGSELIGLKSIFDWNRCWGQCGSWIRNCQIQLSGEC